MEIEGINHVCLVVRDRTRAEWFYGEVLGFAKHEKVNSWYTLCPSKSTLHIIEVTEAGVDKSWYHQVQHVAFQVPNLRKILATLLGANLKPFQMDFEGNTKPLNSPDDDLSFGIGTIFVEDPSENLVEFLQLGHGMF